MEKARTDVPDAILFGDTSEAGSVPDCLRPSDGPVYLEGRLVLSLSFKPFGAAIAMMCDAGFAGGWEVDVLRAAPPCKPDGPLERYLIWDDLAGDWYPSGLELVRYEDEDAVLDADGVGSLLWTGPVDTRARIIAVPDLDDAGIAANELHDLRWKRVG